MFTERVGCYGGGGIGGGGLTALTDNVVLQSCVHLTAFAGKLVVDCYYELTDQVTFDVSYRWYQLGLTGTDGNRGLLEITDMEQAK